MTLLEAIQAVIAADDAFDPNDGGPQYEMLDTAAENCRAVLARRPHATGPLIDAARMFVTWNDKDIQDGNNVDWAAYDAAINQCRFALAGLPAPVSPTLKGYYFSDDVIPNKTTKITAR